MRGRRLAALLVLLIQLLLLCTACQSAEEAVNQSSDAANVSGAAEPEATGASQLGGEYGETEQTESPEKQPLQESAAEFVPETLALAVPGLERQEKDQIIGAYDADLDHDGKDEEIILLYLPKEVTDHGRPQIDLVVMKDSQEIYRGRSVWVKENGLSEAFMLYSKDDRKYLVEYAIDDYGASGTEYAFAVYYLTEIGEVVVEDNDRLWLDALNAYSISAFPVEANKLTEYAEHVNQYFQESIVLCSSIGGVLSASDSGEALYYTEELQAFFDGKADYDGCGTIEDKVERLNQTLLDKWFPGGQIPEMPENFSNRIAELMSERKSEMSTFAEIMEAEDRSAWFEDYSGEKLKLMKNSGESNSLVVYYRADEGETAEVAAKRMVEAIYKSYTVPSEERTFTVTDYLITDQRLYSWESVVEEYTLNCWELYLRSRGGVVGDDLLDYAESWMSWQSLYDTIPLTEDVWYFWPSGYYRYEGIAGVQGSFGDMSLWDMSMLVDGMRPFYYQGGAGATEYLLMKMGDVYRLEKGSRWPAPSPDVSTEPFDAEIEGINFKNILAVHSADLDHDGENESVVVHFVDKNMYGDPKKTIAISVVKNGRMIWECADLWIKQNPLHEAYFLYTAEDGKSYLVDHRQYHTNFYEASYRWFFLKEVDAAGDGTSVGQGAAVDDGTPADGAAVDNGTASEAGTWQTETWGINSLRVHWEGISYKLDVNKVVNYVDSFNEILENSIILCSNSGGKFSYSTEESPLTYREELKVLFDGQVDYSGCETMEEKVAALNEILLPASEFGELTYSVELEQLFDGILSENADTDGKIPTAETLDKSKWFADYNGEKLQVINPDKYAGCSMDAFIGTVFYRADEGETPADVAKRMVEAAAEAMTIPSENRSFTFTKYLITEQKLLQPNYLGEDIWYFYPDGYFRYDGRSIMGTFENYAATSHIMVDGMLPFYSQGSDGAVVFMLMRDGDVYRMQKAVNWGE